MCACVPQQTNNIDALSLERKPLGTSNLGTSKEGGMQVIVEDVVEYKHLRQRIARAVHLRRRPRSCDLAHFLYELT